MFDLWTPLRALIVALAGLLLAWLWFNGQVALAVIAAFAAAIVGFAFDRVGRAMLPKRPVLAVRLLEGWILTPATLAAIGSAAVVIVTVTLTIPEGAKVDPDVKELIATLSTALTAFVSAVLISWASNDDDTKLADHIREMFWSKYGRDDDPKQPLEHGAFGFHTGSPGELWVYAESYGGIEGWGRTARLKRAQGIASAMKPSP